MHDLTAGGVEAPSGRTERDLAIIARVARSMLGTTDLDEQLTLTLALATEALGADRGSVMMIDPDSGSLRVRCGEGLPPEAWQAEVPLGHGIAGWVAGQNEPVLLHGGVADPRFAGVDPTIGSALSVPMTVRGKVIGVLNLVRRTGQPFTDQDLVLADALADLSAIAAERAGLHTALREREARVSDLLDAAIRAQEQERRRIAADIHDGFLQDLTALFLKVEIAKMRLARGEIEEARASFDALQEAVRRQMGAMRALIFQVRPPSLDEVGLGPTIKALLDQVAAEHPVDIFFEDSIPGGRMPEAIETVLYRIAQEAMRNVVRHSQARRAWVRLNVEGDEVLLSVEDNGNGIPADPAAFRKPGHYGVETMRERVELARGRFEIRPRPDGGTLVIAALPLPEVALE